ncbi:MAG: efflux RND transporter periplasmic adaptor subunit [Bacteroidales bacterium]|nr:efflux RND transporter periplasmic adaptor subunit [Bacteroidales bacterium]
MHKLYHTLLICAGLILTCGCGHDHSGHDGHNHENDSEENVGADGASDNHEHGDNIIEFSPEKQKAAGIVVEKVSPGFFYSVVKAGGRILAASGDEMTVSATGSGIVRFSRELTDGMSIAKGTSLFSISSAMMADEGQAGQSGVAVKSAAVEYERAKKLAAEKLISEKDLQEARTNFELAQQAAGAIGRLKSAGGVSIVAPMGGYVKEVMVTPGAFVNAGDPLMTITQNKNLYLRAEVPERHYKALSAVGDANFKTSYTDNIFSVSEMGGRKITSPSAVGTGSTMIPVTFEFPNKGGLVAGSYAEITLLGGKRENVISVPKEALVEDQCIYHLFVRHGDDHFEKVEVEIGENDGRRVEIKKGLSGGEEVVVDGAMKLKLASATTAIPAHTHNH